MKTAMNAKKRPTTETRTRYWPVHKQEKRERDVEIFERSVLEMVRQQPGIRETGLKNMYTKREQAFVDEALLRLKSDYRIVSKEDEKSPRLYLHRPGSTLHRETGQEETMHIGAQGLSRQS
jgi:hypothetical protein